MSTLRGTIQKATCGLPFFFLKKLTAFKKKIKKKM
jgi:hypothetical protein